MPLVLLVDDEQSLLDITKLYLEKNHNLNVDVCSSVPIAIEKMKRIRYDAVISDYLMPETDGIQFLKHVRHSFGNIPFILFTGKGREEIVIDAINHGVDFYLQKGGEPRSQFAELAHKIKIAIDKKRAEFQLMESRRRMTDVINFPPDAVFAIDTEGRVIAWNNAMEEMTGIKTQDILGTGDYTYSVPFYGRKRPMLIDMVSGKNRELEGTYPHLIKQERKLISENYFPSLYNGTGSHLWFIASALYGKNGTIIGAVESFRNISVLKTIGRAVQGIGTGKSSP